MKDDFCYFENHECKYYPCHKGSDNINCMFCFCPFYTFANCPGNPAFIEKNGVKIKKCTDCLFPHLKDNYSKVISLLKTRPVAEENLKEYVHGGESSRRIKYDFSVNVNPLGMPAKVKTAIKKSAKTASLYPDQKCLNLKNAIAVKKHVGQDNVLVGNGASDLITLLARWLQSQKKTRILLLAPTFGGYERALLGCNIKPKYYDLKKELGFALTRDFLSCVTDDLDAIFLCNPNNPTSSLIEEGLLREIVELCAAKNIILVADECFMDFVDKKNAGVCKYIDAHKNIVLINAFTKIYAMAGLRLGYALCSDSSIVKQMEFLQSEWNVSSLAQAAGLEALTQESYLKKTIRLIERERIFLEEELSLLGMKVYPSDANFILVETKENVFEKLLDAGILVRDCSDFKNLGKGFIRIAIQTRRKNKILLSALKKVLKENDRR